MFFCVYERGSETIVGNGGTLETAFSECEEASGDPLDHINCTFYRAHEIQVVREFSVVTNN